MRKSLSLMLVFVFILTLSACNNAKAPSVRSALIEQFSHAQQPLSAEISPSPSSTGRPLLSMPGDTSDGQVFDSPNGDGYTPYNLKWDMKNGAITFEVQQNSIWEETNEGTIYNGYKIAIFRDGSAIQAEEWGGYTDYVRIEIDLFEGEGEWLSAEEVEYRRKLFEPDGEYVFTVYAYNYEEDKVLGEVAKSEPYIVGGPNATQPSEPPPEPLGLEVDFRSETQAVFTISNADLSPAGSYVGANYTRQWVLSFDEHRFVVVRGKGAPP